MKMNEKTNQLLEYCLTTTQKPTTRTVHTHAQPHKPHTHSPYERRAYVCDNGGTWNHSLQRCDCPTGFGGKTGFPSRTKMKIVGNEVNFQEFGVIMCPHAQRAIVVLVKSLTM